MNKWFALNKPAIWIVIAVFAAGFGLWWWHKRDGNQLSFRTAVVRRGDVAATINSSGTLEPVEVVDVGAQVAGRIISFGTDITGRTIDYDSVVEKGAVLAKIDDSVYAAALAVANAQVAQVKAGELSAAANVEEAKAKFVQAEADWNRAQSLTDSKLMAISDSDTARANYAVAKAGVSVADAALAEARANTVQAQASLDGAQRNLDFCIITSPVKGVIIDRRVNIGQTVVSSLNAPSLFLIAADLTRMQIWVSVNEADVARIKPGAPVTFTCDAFPGREFSGSVGKVRLNATMSQNVVMYTVEVNTENPDNVLLPYMTANVHFIVQKESNALLVPNSALRWSPSSPREIVAGAHFPDTVAPPDGNNPSDAGGAHGSQSVIWLKEGDFVRPLVVKAGTSDGADTAVMADGLQEGREVVIGEASAKSQDATKNPFLPSVIRR